MSKSFRDLVEAINKKAKDDLAVGSKHRVKSMAKFVAAHDVKSDYPADRDDGKTISILNAKKTAPDSAKHDNAVAGERKIVRQGTSKVVEDVSSMLTKIAHSGKWPLILRMVLSQSNPRADSSLLSLRRVGSSSQIM